jgi:hypothetical protein
MQTTTQGPGLVSHAPQESCVDATQCHLGSCACALNGLLGHPWQSFMSLFPHNKRRYTAGSCRSMHHMHLFQKKLGHSTSCFKEPPAIGLIDTSFVSNSRSNVRAQEPPNSPSRALILTLCLCLGCSGACACLSYSTSHSTSCSKPCLQYS